MKACIVQPHYSTDFARSDELFRWEMDIMDACDESMDLIVLPESCDDAAAANRMLDMGVDTILTNDYQRISLALRNS